MVPETGAIPRQPIERLLENLVLFLVSYQIVQKADRAFEEAVTSTSLSEASTSIADLGIIMLCSLLQA